MMVNKVDPIAELVTIDNFQRLARSNFVNNRHCTNCLCVHKPQNSNNARRGDGAPGCLKNLQNKDIAIVLLKCCPNRLLKVGLAVRLISLDNNISSRCTFQNLVLKVSYLRMENFSF